MLCVIPRSDLIDQVFSLSFPASLIILYWMPDISNFILWALDSFIFLRTLLSLVLGCNCFLRTQSFCVLFMNFARPGQGNI